MAINIKTKNDNIQLGIGIERDNPGFAFMAFFI
jgi:hypothetical protein